MSKKNNFGMRPLFSITLGVLIASLLLYLSSDLSLCAGSNGSLEKADEKIEGLWSYQELIPRGREGAPLTGWFLFHDGYFIQQSINDGEPFEEQMGMAHAGPYEAIEKGYQIVAEIGIGVAATSESPLSLRRNNEHQIFPEYSGDRLIITFGSGTVQTFKRIEVSKCQIFALDKGYLGFADNNFVLVTALENGVITGSGTCKKEGSSLQLKVMRWFSVLDGQVSYLKDKILNVKFDGKTLTLADGHVFHVTK